MKRFKTFLAFALTLCIMACSFSAFGAYAEAFHDNDLESSDFAVGDLQPLAATYCGGTITDDTVIGFSGETYYYQSNGNQVTLTKGVFTKTGSQNQYSIAFASNLGTMRNCVYQLTDVQRDAWLIVRTADLLLSFSMPLSVSFFERLLSTCGVDLGDQLSSTALLLSQWYNAELNAKKNFQNF